MVNIDRLFEGLTNSRWEFGNKSDVICLYNPNRTRLLSYDCSNRSDDVDVTEMELAFRNHIGVWQKVMSVRIANDETEAIEVIVSACEDINRLSAESLIKFSEKEGAWYKISADEVPFRIVDPRVRSDRLELLFLENQIPEAIDLELTANLFIDQLSKGEMDRPVLVPSNWGTIINNPITLEEVRMVKRIKSWLAEQR